MAHWRRSALERLRGRHWRLAALVLWAVVVLGNLGAALELKAAALPDDIHSFCSVNGATEPPAPGHSEHAGAPHCPLCFVLSAGVLAPPSGHAILVLAPASGWAGPAEDSLAPPAPPLSLASARPRAPPASV